MKYSVYFFFIVITAACISCGSNEAQDSSPEITFLGMNKDIITQGSLGLEDTLVVGFSFVDINGDIGSLNGNIVVIDNRNEEIHLTNSIPELPSSDNGNRGQINLDIPTLCCLFADKPPCSAPTTPEENILSFNLYIIDAAGNKSNEITTPDIKLICS